jgi:hypothetical protein
VSLYCHACVPGFPGRPSCGEVDVDSMDTVYTGYNNRTLLCIFLWILRFLISYYYFITTTTFLTYYIIDKHSPILCNILPMTSQGLLIDKMEG